ncbi:hypothetical protein MMC29_006857, partial [Sticta canariensis]|nr:hypothetical protein [Sticta canariensis]
MDACALLLDARIAQPEAVMERDFMYPSMEQLPLGSLFEKPQPEISYICSIIRITRADEVVGTTQEGGHNLRYRIELLAPSAGIRTFLPDVFVPENFDAIGSCVLSLDPMETGDCEISAVTVLIWDRVLHLAIVGLLIGYARDFAAGLGFHHLLVSKVEGVVEDILRVIGWKNCGCKGLGGDGRVGLCCGSWAAEQESSQTQDSGEPEDDSPTEETDEMGEESGSNDGVVKVTKDEATNHQARKNITPNKLVKVAAKENRDVNRGAGKNKRSFNELDFSAADEPASSKRILVGFTGSCNHTLGCQHERVKHRTAATAGSSLAKNSGFLPASEKPVFPASKVPPLPIIRASKKPPNEPIKRGLGMSGVLSQFTRGSSGSSMLGAPSHPSSVPTVFGNSIFLPTALSSGEPADFRLDSTRNDRYLFDNSGSARQEPKTKLVQPLINKFQSGSNERIDPTTPAQRSKTKQTLELRTLVDKLQRDNRDGYDSANQAMQDLNVEYPINAVFVSDNTDRNARGDRNTLRTSTTTLNTPRDEDVLSRLPKSAQADDDLQNPARLKAHDVKDSPAALIPSLREGEPAEQLKNNLPSTEIGPKLSERCDS